MFTERWVDSDSTPEHEEFIHGIEKELETFVTNGDLDEETANTMLQRVEVYQGKIESSEDVKEKVKYFIEMIVIPVVYSLKEIKEQELNIAELQGLAQLEKEAITERLGEEGVGLLKNIEEMEKRFDSMGANLRYKKEWILDSN